MPLGKIKQVPNTNRKFGSSGTYWFLKAQSGYGEEEYWLVTEAERQRFVKRAKDNPEDTEPDRRGVFDVVENGKRKFGSDNSYFSVSVREKGGSKEHWLLTAVDLERLRERSEENADDLEVNHESWLADLLD